MTPSLSRGRSGSSGPWPDLGPHPDLSSRNWDRPRPDAPLPQALPRTPGPRGPGSYPRRRPRRWRRWNYEDPRRPPSDDGGKTRSPRRDRRGNHRSRSRKDRSGPLPHPRSGSRRLRSPGTSRHTTTTFDGSDRRLSSVPTVESGPRPGPASLDLPLEAFPSPPALTKSRFRLCLGVDRTRCSGEGRVTSPPDSPSPPGVSRRVDPRRTNDPQAGDRSSRVGTSVRPSGTPTTGSPTSPTGNTTSTSVSTPSVDTRYRSTSSGSRPSALGVWGAGDATDGESHRHTWNSTASVNRNHHFRLSV